MSRVLLVCPEPLGHGQPAGIGIRFLEMARILGADGHSVTLVSPDGGSDHGARGVRLSVEVLAEESSRHDVAVLQGHVGNAFFDHAAGIPTVVDLYDPYIVENFHYYESRGAEVFAHDHATLMRSAREGDFFLCASEAQKLFYSGLLLAAGRINPLSFGRDPKLDSLLSIVPFGVHEPQAVAARDLAAPAILFGGIYDWYDAVLAIDAVAIVRDAIPGTTLTFTHHPNPEITPQGELARAMAHTRTHGYDFVRFVPWARYAERSQFYERHALALLTFPQSIETDLSMRTRVYDYLWCALPIVTSSAPGTDEILSRYGAGVVVRSSEAEAFARELIVILRTHERYTSMVEGTKRFVTEHQWERTLGPLRRFCAKPHVDPFKRAFARPQPAVAADRESLFGRIRRRLRA